MLINLKIIGTGLKFELDLESRVRRLEEKFLPADLRPDDSNFQLKLFSARVDESLKQMEEKLVSFIHSKLEGKSSKKGHDTSRSHNRSKSPVLTNPKIKKDRSKGSITSESEIDTKPEVVST